MLVGVALVLVLISRVVTHPEAGHHHSRQAIVGSRR
jgi:hypothetical protein